MDRVVKQRRIVIPSDRKKAAEVQSALMADVAAMGFSDHACFGVRLALEEALTNAIRHGNHGDPAKNVTVSYQLDVDTITITICDEGHGFSPAQVPDPTLDENLDKPCGRGVMLMKAYMSEVIYNQRGNCVTMVKHRSCPLPS
jgi:serine/threonine-protein kinase RsbW